MFLSRWVNVPSMACQGSNRTRYAAIASTRAPPGQATHRTLAGVTYTHRPAGLTPLAPGSKPCSVRSRANGREPKLGRRWIARHTDSLKRGAGHDLGLHLRPRLDGGAHPARRSRSRARPRHARTLGAP